MGFNTYVQCTNSSSSSSSSLYFVYESGLDKTWEKSFLIRATNRSLVETEIQFDVYAHLGILSIKLN